MEIDKERLEQLIFGMGLSSGPPVFVLYSQDTNDFYTNMNKERHPSDEIVFTYDMTYRMNHNFENLRSDLNLIISTFKPRFQIREDKLENLLK